MTGDRFWGGQCDLQDVKAVFKAVYFADLHGLFVEREKRGGVVSFTPLPRCVLWDPSQKYMKCGIGERF